MAIRELSEKQFEATFVAPMRRLAIGDTPPVSVSLKDYVAEAVAALSLPTSAQQIEIHHVYVAHGDGHTHVYFYSGRPDTYLAVVVDNRAKCVLGHRVLDFRALYGLK